MCDHRYLHVLTHSFPTRRSSELRPCRADVVGVGVHRDGPGHDVEPARIALEVVDPGEQVNGRYWCVECRGDVHRKILAQTRGSGRHPAILAFAARERRSEEHTSELQSLMRSSYAVFCLKKKKN